MTLVLVGVVPAPATVGFRSRRAGHSLPFVTDPFLQPFGSPFDGFGESGDGGVPHVVGEGLQPARGPEFRRVLPAEGVFPLPPLRCRERRAVRSPQDLQLQPGNSQVTPGVGSGHSASLLGSPAFNNSASA